MKEKAWPVGRHEAPLAERMDHIKDRRLSDKILRLVTRDEAIKPWMTRYLSSPEGRKHLQEHSSGNQPSVRNR